MNNRNRIIFLLILGLLFITACATPRPSAQQEPVTIKVANFPFISYAPFYIGIEEGYFEEQGIDLELVDIRLAQEMVPALVSGQVDASAGLLSAGLFNTVASGGEMKIVADKGYVDPDGCDTFAILAAPSIATTVDWSNPEEIRGRTIDIAPATWTAYFAAKVLETVGLSLSDMEIVDLPITSELPAMSAGTLELNSNSEPWVTRMVQAGSMPVIASQKEVLPESLISGVFYGPALLGDNADAGNRFMVAYLKGVRQYNEGKTDRNIEILSEQLSLEPDLLREMCWQTIKANGAINTESLLDFQDWAADSGYIENKITLDQIWEPKFVEYAVSELGEVEQ